MDYNLKFLVWAGECEGDIAHHEDNGGTVETGQCLTPKDWQKFGEEIDTALLNSGLYLGVDSQGVTTSRLYLIPGTCGSVQEARDNGEIISIDLDVHKLERLAFIVNSALAAQKLNLAQLHGS